MVVYKYAKSPLAEYFASYYSRLLKLFGSQVVLLYCFCFIHDVFFFVSLNRIITTSQV